MEKARLINFINKYYLNGLVQTVAINSNGSLSTKFITDDKCVVGEVSLHNFGSDEAEFGVNNTDLLLKLLGVLGNDVSLKINKAQGKAYSLAFDDQSTNVNFMLADLSVIPPTPPAKGMPDFEVTIPITKEFLDRFIKAKSALQEVERFTVSYNQKTGKYNIVLGQQNRNSTRISIEVEHEGSEIDNISFSAKYLREILATNKDMNGGTLKVSSQGLAVVEFDIDEFDAKYYLVKLDDN